MTVAESDSLTAARFAVLRSGVADDTPVAVADDQVTDLVTWAVRERLQSALALAVNEGTVVVGPEAVSPVFEVHLGALRATVTAEAAALHAIGCLRDGGVEVRLWKGLAAAHLDHREPEDRVVGDADLLVRRSDLVRSISVLERAGYRRTEPSLGRRWEARFARAVVLASPHGPEVDVHAAVAPGWFGVRLDHERLMDAAPDDVRLGATDCAALGSAARMLTTACAAVLSRGGRLRLLRDLALQVLVTGVDADAAAAVAGPDGEVVVEVALALCREQLRLDHPRLAFTASVPSDCAARRELAAALEATRWRDDAAASVRALAPVDKARFVVGAGLATPPVWAHRLRRLAPTRRRATS